MRNGEPITTNASGEKLLAVNVIILAIKDLRLALRRQYAGIKSFIRDNERVNNEKELKELKNFFNSNYCYIYANFDGKQLYKKIEEQEKDRWNKKKEQNDLWNS